MRAALLLLAVTAAEGGCPSYGAVANLSRVSRFDFARYTGTWYEVYSHNIPVLSTGCKCSHYRYGYDGAPATNASEQFTCNKFSYSSKPTTLHMTMTGVGVNKSYPGESLSDRFFGTFSGPYWILDFIEDPENPQGPYKYALPYACALGSEYTYLFSRTPTMPDSVRDNWLGFLKARGVDTSSVKQIDQGPKCTYS
eukprot:TRINITY_DN6181_c6_g1_i1.p1 TRINITY_DN6181_c6_g1~~TRINITY_DN6181_c6_g1_i1.p1  ORF type:complete len:196 (+),score=67.93 TRINITY_DN6181_c6_g1_i1:76-663(+)